MALGGIYAAASGGRRGVETSRSASWEERYDGMSAMEKVYIPDICFSEGRTSAQRVRGKPLDPTCEATSLPRMEKPNSFKSHFKLIGK